MVKPVPEIERRIAEASERIANKAMERRDRGLDGQAQDLEWASQVIIEILIDASEPMTLPGGASA